MTVRSSHGRSYGESHAFINGPHLDGGKAMTHHQPAWHHEEPFYNRNCPFMIEFYSCELSTVAFTQMAEQNLMLSIPPSGSSPVFSVILFYQSALERFSLSYVSK